LLGKSHETTSLATTATQSAAHSPAAQRRVCVVHLIHSMAYGGIETVIINWLRCLDQQRFRVHLVCFANSDHTEEPFVNAARDAGLEVDKIPWSRRKPILRAGRTLAQILRRVGADILHTHNCYADLTSLVAARLVPVKTVTTLYVWDKFGWKRNLIQAINRRLLPFFDLVTAQCEETRRQTASLGFSADRVKLLASGFESDRIDMTDPQRRQKRREMGVDGDDVVLVNVARLFPEKAQDLLLKSFHKIHTRWPQTQLWILGVGPQSPQLQALCTELGLDDAVRFFGFVSDLAAVLRLADIQVHPSYAEGIPLAICSGMAAGLPIVASRVGGLPEVLDDGHSGLLVPPADEAAITDAVGVLIEDPVQRQRLGSNARRFIENEYSLASAVTGLEQTYFELLDNVSK